MPAGERIKGSEGIIELSDGVTTEEIPNLTEWTLNTQANLNEQEASFMLSNGDGGAAAGGQWSTKTLTSKSFSFTTNHRWQEDQTVGTTGIADVTDIGAEVTFKLYPNGNASGQVEYSGTALIQSVSVPSQADEEMTQEITFEGTGALVKTIVPV